MVRLFAFVGAFVVLDLLWLWWADRRLRRLRGAKAWRIGVAALVVMLVISMLIWIFIPTALRRTDTTFYAIINLLIFTWHLVIMPIGWLLAGIFSLGTLITWIIAKVRRPKAAAEIPAPTDHLTPALSRRQLLGAAVVAAPPLLLGGAAIGGAAQIGTWRIRRLAISLPTLPRALDGMTIAHVSDTHIGRYTNAAMLDRIVESTNALRADLVLMTGDLIDFMIDDLPQSLDMVRRFDAPLALCCGNHDLFQDPRAFIGQTQRAGFNLLVGQWTTLYIRGVPVDIGGIPWATGEKPLQTAVSRLVDQRAPRELLADGRFPILLAHHPHAFDPAADAGFPLTLAGHVHGGQLMLARNFGPASLIYRYISGLYQKQSPERTALFVSNGVGNWFPLRLNAPAEIAHLTLRRA